LQQVLKDGTPSDIAGAQISFQHATEIMSELLVERIIQSQLGPQSSQRLGIRPLADHSLNRIAGRHVEQEKGYQEHAE